MFNSDKPTARTLVRDQATIDHNQAWIDQFWTNDRQGTVDFAVYLDRMGKINHAPTARRWLDGLPDLSLLAVIQAADNAFHESANRLANRELEE